MGAVLFQAVLESSNADTDSIGAPTPVHNQNADRMPGRMREMEPFCLNHGLKSRRNSESLRWL